MKKIADERKLKRQAEELAAALCRAGYDNETVLRRVQRAMESARRRREGRTSGSAKVNPYAGCRSVTAVAPDVRMTRDDLFAWLEREGWLRLTVDGWRPTDGGHSAGWVVLRGRGAVQWVQLTPAGVDEIARRIGIATRGQSHE